MTVQSTVSSVGLPVRLSDILQGPRCVYATSEDWRGMMLLVRCCSSSLVLDVILLLRIWVKIRHVESCSPCAWTVQVLRRIRTADEADGRRYSGVTPWNRVMSVDC